jgi:hypothetical protein
MGLLLDFLNSVLPGPEETSPPIQQKYTAILRNHTTKLNFQISAAFLLLALFFFIVTDNTKTQLFYNLRYLATLLLSGGYGFCKI